MNSLPAVDYWHTTHSKLSSKLNFKYRPYRWISIYCAMPLCWGWNFKISV